MANPKPSPSPNPPPTPPSQQAKTNRESTQSVPKNQPQAYQVCPSCVVEIGIFFDGTNNNNDDKRNQKENKDTNVAKLYDLLKPGVDHTKKEAVYYSGVGSNSKHDPSNPIYNFLGQVSGLGSRPRVRMAMAELVKFFNKSPGAGHKIIYVYGFSRGSAIARDFINVVSTYPPRHTTAKFISKTGPQRSPSTYTLYPPHTGIQFKFLGIFDTVSSIGVPGSPRSPGFNFGVNFKRIQNVRHFIAEDEHRPDFSLHSIRSRPFGPLPGNAKEWAYPGAHSDLGGGYFPGEEGIATNEYSNIPLSDMYNESSRAGVPLAAYPAGDPRYRVSGPLQQAYSKYVADRQAVLKMSKDQYIHSLSGGSATIDQIENKRRELFGNPYAEQWWKRMNLASYQLLKAKYIHIMGYTDTIKKWSGSDKNARRDVHYV